MPDAAGGVRDARLPHGLDFDVDLDRLAGRVERASELVRLLKARIRDTELKVVKVVEELREESEDAAAENDDEAVEEDRFEGEEEQEGGFTRDVPF